MSWTDPTPGGGWQMPPARQPVPGASITSPKEAQWDAHTPQPISSSGDAPADPLTDLASPPVLWLVLAATLAGVGLVLPLLLNGATVGTIGWFLAGPAAIALVGVFMVQDAKARGTGWYAQSDLADVGRRIVIVLAVIAVALNAWEIANDVARGIWR